MKQCTNCHAKVKGDWDVCPLCHHPFIEPKPQDKQPSFPDIPLRFNREKVTKLLTLVSVFVIIAYFIIRWFWTFQIFGLDYVLFGIMSMWMAVLIIIRKRRNITKGIVYLILFLSAISLYFDYSSGWSGWSITYSIPIICTSALIAMFLSIQVVRLDTEDYVLYLQAAALLGFIPLIFLWLDWTTYSLPSWVSFITSTVMFWSVVILHGKKILKALRKRVDL